MSRLERERWALAGDRWPNLQRFLSEEASQILLGDAANVPRNLKCKVDCLAPPAQMTIASECWDFLACFSNRHDDRSFLRDGFGVSGKPPADDRGKGQAALSRIKLLYGLLAEAIRLNRPEWKPGLEEATGSQPR